MRTRVAQERGITTHAYQPHAQPGKPLDLYRCYVCTCAMGSQSKAIFATFMAHYIDSPNAQYLEVDVVAVKGLEAHRKLKGLIEMAQHPTMHREKPVVWNPPVQLE